MKRLTWWSIPVLLLLALRASSHTGDDQALTRIDRNILNDVRHAVVQGRQIFRFDTFGDEAFWGDTIKLHQAIQGARFGGVGPGVSPKAALAVGLKVDVDALPRAVVDGLKAGKIDLNDPANTLALLKANAVVGVTGRFDANGRLRTMGVQCALCHSTVDDSLASGTVSTAGPTAT